MEPDDCPHTHYAIIAPTPWQLNFLIECRDCGAVAEWPTSGVKTFDETRAEIRAAMQREYPQAHEKSEKGA